MSKDEKQSGVTLPHSSFIVAAFLATGTYWFIQDEPLRGSRPVATEIELSEKATDHIEARLWEDPFPVVSEWREKRKSQQPMTSCDGEEPDDSYCQPPKLDGDNPRLVLGVTMPGARYPEVAEGRRRTRYAVLAGLNNSGYVPVDSEHINYFRVVHEEAKPALSLSRIVIPYEWFTPRQGWDLRPILVFWLDESVLGDRPLCTFSRLISFLRRDGAHPLIRILGPATSDILRAMAIDAGRRETFECNPAGPARQHRHEASIAIERAAGDEVLASDWRQTQDADNACPQPAENWPSLAKVHFYSSDATAPDFQILETNSTSVREYFRKCGVRMERIIAPDDVLARAIAAELKRRGIDPQHDSRDHIALVTEWDTLYGQTFPDTVARSLDVGQCTTKLPSEKCRVHVLKYLRGLDGQLPRQKTKKPESNGEASGENHSARGQGQPQINVKELERPNGQSQFDYLRRLAVRLREIDQELRRDGKRIKAVGVLGSDVFDKLLVLRALRPGLPHALYFTTDLDLNLTLPSELKWTRNLIVSSSFDLQLESGLQGEIPSFRSAYQTSDFLATMLAICDTQGSTLEDAEGSVTFPARLFEIGKAGQPLSLDDVSKAGDREPHSESWAARFCGPMEGRSIATIHPRLTEYLFPAPKSRAFWCVASGVAVATALGLFMCPAIRRHFADHLRDVSTKARPISRALGVILALIILIFVFALLITHALPSLEYLLTEDGQGEPLAFLDGLSVWPTVFLQLVSICLSVWFILRAQRKLRANLHEIALDLRIDEACDCEADLEAAIDTPLQADKKSSPLENFLRRFSYIILQPTKSYKASACDSASTSCCISRAWQFYIYQGRPTARWTRVLAGLAIVVVLGSMLIFLFDHWADPVRGRVASILYHATAYLDLVAVTVLTILVADATLMFKFFVNEVRDNRTDWPEKCRTFWKKKIGIKSGLVNDWIDLNFIAKRTQCIAHLIHYPFVVIGLTILSTSTVVSRFQPNLPFLIIQGVGLIVVTGCAVALRMAAESERDAVKSRLWDEIWNETCELRAAELRNLLSRVESLREGAFRPWSQQPVVQALLWPLGTFGAAAVLERLAIPGL
jgi:hypothetical protein